MRKVERFIVYPLLAVGIVVLAFFDLSISKALYSDNVFGRLVEGLGELPFFLVGAFGACLLAFNNPLTHKKVKLGFLIGGLVVAVGLAGYGGYYCLKQLSRAFALNAGMVMKLAIIAGIAAVILVPAILLARKFGKRDTAFSFSYGLTILIVLGVAFLIAFALKYIWLRPRYRTLVALTNAGALENVEAGWLAFYEPQLLGSFSKKYAVGGELGFTQEQIDQVLSALHVSKWSADEFVAFPSGHVTTAASLLILCFFPRLFGRDEKEKNLDLYIRLGVYAFTVLLCIGRLFAGAHSATDVLFAALIGIAVYDLGQAHVFKRYLLGRIFAPVEE